MFKYKLLSFGKNVVFILIVVALDLISDLKQIMMM